MEQRFFNAMEATTRPAVAPYPSAAETAVTTIFANPLSGFRNRLILSPHVAGGR